MNNTTVLKSLLSHLNRSDFDDAVSAYQGDKWSKNFTTYDLFKGMIYGQITRCNSIREIINSLSANEKLLYHAGMKMLRRSTFSDAMEKRKHQIFQSVYHSIVDKAQCLTKGTGRKFKDPLRILDATTISVGIERCPWAYFRKAKGALRIHTLFDGDNLLPLDAKLSPGDEHEITKINKLCRQSGVIYVMDKAYVDYKSLYNIELGGSTFVTRMKENCKYQRVKYYEHLKDGSVISDMKIKLKGLQSQKKYPRELRRVRYHDMVRDKIYDFLTNNFEMKAEEIAAIYKERWQVEIFFKWIKENLKIKTFWGTSKNAVYMQIWTALILMVILWIGKVINGITDSMHQMLQKMKTTLLCKGSIFEICMDKPPPYREVSNQLLLWGKL